MKEIEKLLQIMRDLRDPDNGCPWDREQTFETILPFSMEEVHELADAIRRQSMDELRDELGDLLFHIVFYAQLAAEDGHFDFRAVTAAINEKLLRRHPHVFGETSFDSAQEQNRNWEQIKSAERGVERGGEVQGLLDGIGATLPPISRSLKMQRRAAGVGFDWQNATQVLEKIEEELRELRHEIESGAARSRISGELGDLLFSCINLARHLKIDPELALSETNEKFRSRFGYLEDRLKSSNRSLFEAGIEEMEALWLEAKEQR